MSRYDAMFHEAGGPSYAPLSSGQWWTIYQALREQDDPAVAEALDQLGALVQEDWLDSLPPVPDEERPRAALRAMFDVHDKHEDAWIDRRCGIAIDTLSRLRAAERPINHGRLDCAARVLITTAGELFRVARDRQDEVERGDRDE